MKYLDDPLRHWRKDQLQPENLVNYFKHKWKLSELFEETNYNQEAKYLIQPKIQVNYLNDVFHEWFESGYIHIEFVSALYIYK